MEGETGGGQKNGGAQKVSFTETQRETTNEEEISKLEADYPNSDIPC